MNIRKPTDYATMFAALDAAVAAQLPQTELYLSLIHIYLETHNAELIKSRMEKKERFEALRQIAQYQLRVLAEAEKIKE